MCLGVKKDVWEQSDMVALQYRGRGILKLVSELSTSWTLAL